MSKHLIYLGFENSFQEQIFSALFAGCGVQAQTLTGITLEDQLALLPAPKLVLVDLAYLQARGMSVAKMADALHQLNPTCHLVLQHSNTWVLSAAERAWGSHQGVAAFLPALHPRRLESSVLPVGRQLAKLIDVEFSMELAKRFLNARKPSERFALSSLDEALDLNALEKLDRRHLTVEQLSEIVRGSKGFKVQDLTYHFKRYPQVFKGDEATQWLASTLNLSTTRAVDVGDLLRRSRVIEHVSKEHAFSNAAYFYRFTQQDEAIAIAKDPHLVSKISSTQGFVLGNRSYLGKTYPSCLVGNEAVEILVNFYQCSRQAATQVGQMLQDLGYLSHVTAEHEFKDEPYFYTLAGLNRVACEDLA